MTSLIEARTALYTPDDIAISAIMSGPYRERSAWTCRRWSEDIKAPMQEAVTIAGEKDGKITGFYRPMICFGPDQWQEAEIGRLWECSQDIVYQDYLLDGRLSPISRFLLARGYKAEPYFTQVIDLRRTEEQLRREVRKSYRSLINKQEEVRFCAVSVFQGIHEKVKGKTRAQETWEIQMKMNTVCACRNDMTAGCMFYYGPQWSYYASAAGDNSHACIWSCLMELKKWGVQFAEMGEQTWNQTDPKLVNISHHKAGYGGQTQVRLNVSKPST